MTARIAIPSRGRLHDVSLALLEHAGYPVAALGGRGSTVDSGAVEFIEMRPADAAAWLEAGRLAAAIISTDAAYEHGVERWPTTELNFARSELVLACRQDATFAEARDLQGATVATHLPQLATRWFAQRHIPVTTVQMGGSLEGVCAAGLADAIVDLRETGASLAENRLRVLETIAQCQALFVWHPDHIVTTSDLRMRIEAALAARGHQYLMLHLPPGALLDDLTALFHGLASPTVLPLAGREDLIAVHLVVERTELWERLGALRAIGASGIVALPTDALLP